ncbi:MAG: cytochrome c biogenesis protein, partial [Planctomycetota bacterium]
TLRDEKEFKNLFKGILALSIAITRQSHEKANEIIRQGIARELKNLNITRDESPNVELEYFYIKYNLIQKASYFFLVALIFVVISLIGGGIKTGRIFSLLVASCGFLLETIDLVLRIIISSRAPVSSFYESIYYISWGIFLFSFIYYVIFKNYIVISCGIFLNTLILILTPYTGLNPHIKVLMPALRSYWLIYHVHTITLSYALFAISYILSHIIGIKYLLKKELDNDLINIVSRMIQAGIVFLSIGIMLGSIWGAEAWGRYWGWDPKETWALITLLGYLTLIHMKKAGTIGHFGITIGTILCFFLVVITYYGGSFIFVGLHSYAGDNITNLLPSWLIITALVECIFIGYSIFVHNNILLTKSTSHR